MYTLGRHFCQVKPLTYHTLNLPQPLTYHTHTYLALSLPHIRYLNTYTHTHTHAYKALNLQQSLTYHTLKLTGIKR